jgi:hypothetical protein
VDAKGSIKVATEFPYSIANDFPNDAVNVAVLTAEINAAGGGSFLDHIDVGGDTVTVFTTTDLTAPQETGLDNVIAAHQGVGFVEGPQRLFSEAEQTTTSTTAQTAATLTSGLLAAGDYLLTWYAEISVQTADATSGAIASVLWDGTERGTHGNNLAFYQAFSGVVIVTVAALAAPVFAVQYRRAGTSNTARVRRMRLSISPIAADEE